MSETSLIPAERVERRILLLRGQKVMLDFDLAGLYGVVFDAIRELMAEPRPTRRREIGFHTASTKRK